MRVEAAAPSLGTPMVRTVPPVSDPHLPSLVLDIVVAPDPLPVGETATLSVTVTNQSPDPAHDLVLLLAQPEGATILSGPARSGTAWRWTPGQLAGFSATTLTAQLRLDRLPAGAALLVQAEARARGLPLPVVEVGGALVDTADTAASGTFVPGVDATLRSSDQRVTVTLPARAKAQRLALQHAALEGRAATA